MNGSQATDLALKRPAATSSPRADVWAIAVLSLLCLLGQGCHTTDQPASSFASTTITGNTPGQIRDAAVAVFQADGYKAARLDPAALMFEKEGSRMNELAYGNWLGDIPVWVRVKASIVSAGEMTYRLQCQAFMVRDKGTGAEEEVALGALHRGSYQKLMDKVAQRLAQR